MLAFRHMTCLEYPRGLVAVYKERKKNMKRKQYFSITENLTATGAWSMVTLYIIVL